MPTKNLSLALTFALTCFACAPAQLDEPAPASADLTPPSPDQQPSQPSCAAANGAPGKVLLCADFSKIETLSDPSLGNWNFQAGHFKDCWQLLNGALANKEVLREDYECKIALPAIDLTDPSLAGLEHIAFSISYRNRLEVDKYFEIGLETNLGNSDNFSLDRGGNSGDFPETIRTDTFSLRKTQLPNSYNNIYKPYIDIFTFSDSMKKEAVQLFSMVIVASP